MAEADQPPSRRYRLWLSIFRLILLFVVSYGLLYFSYKHDDPRLSGDQNYLDQYYAIYLAPLSFSSAGPPAVYRQFSACITYLVFKLGLYYPNQIAFNEAGFDQRVFFASLLVNYVGLVLAAWFAGAIAERELGRHSIVAPLLAGLLCFLSFHSQVSVITGLTEGVSWLLFSLCFYFYLRRNVTATLIVLAMAVVQRETILAAFAAIAGIEFIMSRNRGFAALVFCWSILCLGLYIAFRWINFAGLAEVRSQIAPQLWLGNLIDFRPDRQFVWQGLLSQNLLWIYIACAALLGCRREWPPRLAMITASFLVLLGGSIAAGEQTQLGRLAAIMSPVLAALITVCLFRLERPVFSVLAGRSRP